MAEVTIYLFGPAADDCGCARCVLALDAPVTVEELARRLYARFERLGRRAAHLRFAVNQSYATMADLVHPGDEVAVIPPVSGGSPGAGAYVRLERVTISVPAVRAYVMGDAALGGVVTFEGTTREETHPEHGTLVRLEYEAYDEMALKQMHRLADDARQRWPIGRLAMVHRVGSVAPGDVSVMIAVACPHRGEAFEACRWLIDRLKAEAPIWKREVWADAAVTWVEPGGAASSG